MSRGNLPPDDAGQPSKGDGTFIILGLGNPGEEYAGTRHNIGAEAVSVLVERNGGRLRLDKGSRSLQARLQWRGRTMLAAFPQTYMNESGYSAAALVKRLHVTDMSKVIVVHDELDLPSGRVKVKVGGGTAGNNGLKSIVSHLHDQGFLRVRIGIGKPPGRQSGADFVLRRPGVAERKVLQVAAEIAADAVEAICEGGAEVAMNRFNTEP